MPKAIESLAGVSPFERGGSLAAAIGVACLACILWGCSRGADTGPAGSEDGPADVATVYVVNYPLKYFAERIGGEHVRVVFPAPPDEDPAFWNPTPETIAAFQQADLILLNGASYAKWTKRVSLPESKTVNTSAAVSDRYIEVAESVTHSHGPGGEHAHTGTAFTTWLDLDLAIEQAEAIAQRLAKTLPQHEADFEDNFSDLAAELKALDQRLSKLAEQQSDRPLLFSHPVYQYLQRRYKLNGRAVHWEPEVAPSPRMLEELAAIRKQHPAEWMVWEGAPVDESVQRLEELGLRSIVFDPCGNAPEEGDFLSVMRQNVTDLSQALAE